MVKENRDGHGDMMVWHACAVWQDQGCLCRVLWTHTMCRCGLLTSGIIPLFHTFSMLSMRQFRWAM